MRFLAGVRRFSLRIVMAVLLTWFAHSISSQCRERDRLGPDPQAQDQGPQEDPCQHGRGLQRLRGEGRLCQEGAGGPGEEGEEGRVVAWDFGVWGSLASFPVRTNRL